MRWGTWAAAAVVAAGSAALLARPWLVRLPVDPVALLVVLFAVLGLVGVLWRLPAARPGPLPAWAALAIGLGAFGAGRLLAVGTVPAAPLVLRSVALNTLAAVAEEAFYRRFAYGVAATRWGPVMAVGISAAVFAAVHVTVWGWAVFPLDLAAGLVLGWQRWASGRWSVPAATHVAANVWAVV
ncbi:MAG TPA: CPBP family intramembrane glutamic endopeptidase [Acidimicrobiales bacterium]